MQDNSKKIILTITMLVSNRRNTIRKCMDSIKPLLDQVPSELIVVDTGSTDGSIDIVREYTNKIITFEWCRDFSKARNAGLVEASGEWIMSLDDDEWFEDVSEIVDFFNSGEYKSYNRGVYVVRNYRDAAGSDWSDSNAARMVKRFPDTCYTGKVHEFLGPMKEPAKFFDAYAHHYGYVYKSDEESKRHIWRNLSLLEEELEQDPEDMRVVTQLVQEYYLLKESYKVFEFSNRGMDIYKRYHKYPGNAGYCYNFSLQAYIQMQDWDSAYKWGKKILAEGAPTSLALLGTVREMVPLCLRCGHYEDGLDYLRKYWKLYGIVMKDLNREEVFLDLSKYLKKQNHDHAYLDGIALGVAAKDWDMAKKCFSEKNWDASPLVLQYETLDYVMELWAECGFQQEYADVLDKIVRNPPFYKQITDNMEKYERKNSQGYQRLLYIFSVCQDTSSYTNRYRLDYYIRYGGEGEQAAVQNLIEQLWAEDINPLLWEQKIWQIISRKNISVKEIIKQTGLTEWFSQVRSWIEKNVRKAKDWDDIYSIIYCRDEPEEMHFRFLELKHEEGIIRRNLWKMQSEQTDIQWLLNYLDGFYSQMWQFYSGIYRVEMFKYDMATVLPPEAAFAVYIRLAVQNRQEGNLDGYLQMLLKASGCYPPMKEWCKVLMQKEKRVRLNGRTQAEETEFMMLAKQMKQKVRELLDIGNHEAAKLLILQLEKLLPGDAELMELAQNIL